MLNSALFLVFSLSILLVIEWRLALFAAFGLLVSFKCGRMIEPRASVATEGAKKAQAALAAALHENIQAQPVVKLFRLHGVMTESFRLLGARFSARNRRGPTSCCT